MKKLIRLFRSGAIIFALSLTQPVIAQTPETGAQTTNTIDDDDDDDSDNWGMAGLLGLLGLFGLRKRDDVHRTTTNR